MQEGMFSRPRRASWEKTRNSTFVVQIKGNDGEWRDHASYWAQDAQRARSTVHGLRMTYKDTPGVSVRIIRRTT